MREWGCDAATGGAPIDGGGGVLESSRCLRRRLRRRASARERADDALTPGLAVRA